jgi:putative transposase
MVDQTPLQRLPKSAKATESGQLLELDTVYVTLARGKDIMHAYDPVAKWTIAKAYNRASATSAAMLLNKLTADMPFKVDAVRMDGGSEFMAEFEEACRQRANTSCPQEPRAQQCRRALRRLLALRVLRRLRAANPPR